MTQRKDRWRDAGEFLILAARHTDYLPTLEEVRRFYLQPAIDRYGEAFAALLIPPPAAVTKTWDPATFRPIRDNQPFLAGNVQHIFSLQQVGKLFALTGGLLLVFALLLLLLVK